MCLLNIMLLLLFWIANAVGGTAVRSDAVNDVHLVSAPTTIHQDYTSELTLNCSFLNMSHFSSITNLTLSKGDSDHIFKNLAVCTNSASPSNITVQDSLGASVSGQCRFDAESVITYSWKYPQNSIKGEYECEVYGIDQNQHPLANRAFVEIGDQAVDFDVILQRMKENDLKHQTEYALLESKNTYLVNTIQSLHSENAQLKTLYQADISQLKTNHDADIKQLESQLSVQSTDLNQQKANLVSETRITTDLKTRLDKAFSGMFVDSTSYGGHTYRLTNNMFTDVAAADNLCRFFGGYLAEMNDKQEYDHIVAFLKGRHEQTAWIILGANDEHNEGTWSFMDTNHADRTANFFEWGANEPRGGTDANCMFLRPPSYKMVASYCNNWAEMLCEIE